MGIRNLVDSFPSFARKPVSLLFETAMLWIDVIYDTRQYARYACLNGRVPRTQEQFVGLLEKSYHAIEKGMALPSPRPLFGERHLSFILDLLTKFGDRYGHLPVCSSAISSIRCYIRMHRRLHIYDNTIDELQLQLNSVSDKLPSCSHSQHEGGTSTKLRTEIRELSSLDFYSFLRSRHSVRQFSDKPVDLSLILEAAEMAQTTPSVCNRQPWGMYVLADKQEIAQVLSVQGGARGFSHQVDKLLVVVAKLEAFAHSFERYEPWIDGGMFSMSLVYALHSLGLGTCCLNWSRDRHVDRRLRRITPIRESERIVMLIAVGHLPEELQICRATRYPVSDVVVVRQNGATPTGSCDVKRPG